MYLRYDLRQRDLLLIHDNQMCVPFLLKILNLIGIMGSLSTVSTLFAELHNLYHETSPLAALRFVLALFDHF